jgi:hypothetical protein
MAQVFRTDWRLMKAFLEPCRGYASCAFSAASFGRLPSTPTAWHTRRLGTPIPMRSATRLSPLSGRRSFDPTISSNAPTRPDGDRSYPVVGAFVAMSEVEVGPSHALREPIAAQLHHFPLATVSSTIMLFRFLHCHLIMI